MASQMFKRPDEEEQLEIIQKNFTPAVLSCMGKHVFPHFRALLSMGSQVEEELAKKAEIDTKKASYTGRKTATPVVNQLSSYPYQQNPFQQPQQTPPMNWPTKRDSSSTEVKKRKNFCTLPTTLVKSLELLRKVGLITPLNSRPPPNPIPSTWKMNENCTYHQVAGHDTERCLARCHRIQDLIEAGTIPAPDGPNVTNNPLPNHAPPAGINALTTDEESFDPVGLIRDDPAYKSPVVPLERTQVNPSLNSIINQWMAKINFLPGQDFKKANQEISQPITIKINPGKSGI